MEIDAAWALGRAMLMEEGSRLMKGFLFDLVLDQPGRSVFSNAGRTKKYHSCDCWKEVLEVADAMATDGSVYGITMGRRGRAEGAVGHYCCEQQIWGIGGVLSKLPTPIRSQGKVRSIPTLRVTSKNLSWNATPAGAMICAKAPVFRV
jgi:hypothetical protein